MPNLARVSNPSRDQHRQGCARSALHHADHYEALRAHHPLIRSAAMAVTVAASAMSSHPESVGMSVDALRMADAVLLAGTPVPVTCEVVFVIWPGVVACMRIGTLQEAPAPRVTLLSDQPLPLKTALPALHV